MDITNTGLSNRDWNMLHRAANVAATGTARHKHGALIYKGGRVLSVGINTQRNEHPTMEMPRDLYTEHAEVAAIRGLGRPMVWTAEGTTLYVVRIDKHHRFMLSKPCEVCEGHLRMWGVKRVVYSDRNM